PMYGFFPIPLRPFLFPLHLKSSISLPSFHYLFTLIIVLFHFSQSVYVFQLISCRHFLRKLTFITSAIKINLIKINYNKRIRGKLLWHLNTNNIQQSENTGI